MQKVLIIGAQNIDIYAKTEDEYILQDSNLANIHIAFGGVARNIAANIRRMNNAVSFLTIFGDDEFSKSAININAVGTWARKPLNTPIKTKVIMAANK